MKKKDKIAILLNALVMPGVGHMYLGYKLRGAILAMACTFFIIAPIAKYAFLMSFALNVLDFRTMSPSSVLLESAAVVWPHMKVAVLLAIGGILIVWIFGIVDIYFKSPNKS